MHKLPLILAALAATLAVAFAAACGDDDDDGTLDIAGDAQTRVSGAVTEVTGRVTEVTDGDETPGAGGGDTTPPAGAGTDLEIAAENDDGFTVDELTAEAGRVTIVFDNRDDGTAHNFTLYDSPDSRDIEIDATPLVAGPATNEITVELQPAEYYFACQSHPETMNGVLTVE